MAAISPADRRHQPSVGSAIGDAGQLWCLSGLRARQLLLLRHAGGMTGGRGSDRDLFSHTTLAGRNRPGIVRLG
jgi:hypothetical protein